MRRRRLCAALLPLLIVGCAPAPSDACREAQEAHRRASWALTDFPVPFDERAQAELERATQQVLERCRPDR